MAGREVIRCVLTALRHVTLTELLRVDIDFHVPGQIIRTDRGSTDS